MQKRTHSFLGRCRSGYDSMVEISVEERDIRRLSGSIGRWRFSS